MAVEALKLVKGSKDLRDKFVDKVDVLNKIKKLEILPDGHIESKMVSEYFGVPSGTIRNLLGRYKGEFAKDEVFTLSGDDLANYRTKMIKVHDISISAKSHLKLYTKKGVLRLAMLLTKSPVAEKVRNYLLNIEENATEQQKSKAIKRNKSKVTFAADFRSTVSKEPRKFEDDDIDVPSQSDDSVEQMLQKIINHQEDLYDVKVKYLEKGLKLMKKKIEKLEQENQQLKDEQLQAIELIKAANKKMNKVNTYTVDKSGNVSTLGGK